MEEFLPPVVTKLRADLSDMVAGITQARALVRSFADGARADVVGRLRDAGRDAGNAFAAALKASAVADLDGQFARTVASSVTDQATKMGQTAGASTAKSFTSAFSTVAMPLMIGALVLLTPSIVTAVGAAITSAFGLGFLGLGAFLLREQPAVVAAAKRLKDTLSSVFKDAASPLAGPFVTALNILNAGVKELGPSFKQVFAGLGPAAPALAEGLLGFVRELLPGLIEAAPLMAEMVAAVAGMGPDVGAGLADLLRSLVEAGPGMLRFMDDLGESIGGILTFSGQVIAFFSGVYLWLAKLHDKAQAGGWDTPWGAVTTGAKKAWEWIKKVAGAVGDWVSDKATAVSEWWDGVTGSISTKGNEVLTWFEELPGKVGDFLSSLPGKLKDAAVAAFDGFFFWTSFGITRVTMFFEELPTKLGMLAVRAWDAVSTAFQNGVDRTVAFARTVPGRVGDFFSELWATVTGWAERTWNDTVDWVKRTADDMIAWFRGIPERAETAFNNLVEKIKTFFKDAKDWLVQAGKDVVQGLIDGFTSMVEGAVGAVRRAMDRIREGAEAALGVQSPSTVFAEIGRHTVDGFILGLGSRRTELGRAWEAMTGPPPRVLAVAGAATAAAAAGGAAAGGQGGPSMLRAVINIDGRAVLEALVPAAQERKSRNGETGLT